LIGVDYCFCDKLIIIFQLLTKRVEEHGATVVERFTATAEGKEMPDFIVVDDRVHLDAVCHALDRDFPTSKALLGVLQVSAVVRAKWLSLCLQRKEVFIEGDAKLNQFLKVLIN